MVESIQGEGGLHAASDEFLQGLQNLCHTHELLFLMDEVQAGIAGLENFGYQKSGVCPDGIAMAKGLGGGFPIGAIWVCKSIPHSLAQVATEPRLVDLSPALQPMQC